MRLQLNKKIHFISFLLFTTLFFSLKSILITTTCYYLRNIITHYLPFTYVHISVHTNLWLWKFLSEIISFVITFQWFWINWLNFAQLWTKNLTFFHVSGYIQFFFKVDISIICWPLRQVKKTLKFTLFVMQSTRLVIQKLQNNEGLKKYRRYIKLHT